MADSIPDMNRHLNTLNGDMINHYLLIIGIAGFVWISASFKTIFDYTLKNVFSLVDSPVLAKVDENAEIEYSMVGSPVISNNMIEFGFKVISSTIVCDISLKHITKYHVKTCL